VADLGKVPDPPSEKVKTPLAREERGPYAVFVKKIMHLRGEVMVTQTAFGFQYELAEQAGDVTALAGLPLFFQLGVVGGLRESVESHVRARDGFQGWSDWEVVMSLVLLNIAGGDCVDDLERLEGDGGLRRVVEQLWTSGMSRTERREAWRRWRKERTRAFPSPSSVHRYLRCFHNEAEERRRAEVMRSTAAAREDGRSVKGKAFIPRRLEPLRGLGAVNADLVGFVQQHRPQSTATLDMDATLVPTTKSQAHFCYKKMRAYQPLNTWWAEQGLVLHSEFRDGNVPAGFEQRRVLEEALRCLPEGVETVHMRSDTAGYQWELLRYCEEGRNERFGRIEFVVGVDITDAFKEAVRTTPAITWHDLGTSGQQWAEVAFVPNEMSRTNKGDYRFIATREPVRQLEMFQDTPQQFSFPTLIDDDGEGPATVYKLHAVVTNRMEQPAPDVIQWYRNRCGKSEEAHSIMKNDFAGGQLPSKYFGANAAWWALMILAFNLVAAMKHLALDDDALMSKRMKALRLWLVAVPARIISHARKLTIRLGRSTAGFAELLVRAQERIQALAHGPAG